MNWLRITTIILFCVGAVVGIQAPPAVPMQTLSTTTTTSVPFASQSVPGPPCLSPSQADVSTAQFQAGGQNVSIPGHVVPSVRSGNASQKATIPDSTIVHLELVFAPRNAAAFKQCLASLNDPTSPNFGLFLNATTLRPYLPTPGQKQSMASFLQKGGFTVSYGPSPIVLELGGNAGTISRTFGTRLKLYQQGSSSFYSPDSEPKLPQNLGALTSAVTGLDNFSMIRPAETPCGLLGAYPDCPQGVQVGYGFSNLFGSGYDGTGQTVAIVDEPGDPNIQTAINTYDSQYGLPSITLNIQTPDGAPSSYDASWASETAMDVEAVHSVAKGANIVLLYDNNLLKAIDSVASNNLAPIVSNSWIYICSTGACNDAQLPSSTVSSTDTRLQIDSAMGLTILFSTGDQGAKPDGSTLGTEFPASDPNVLAVGATNLALAGCGINTCSGYGSESGASISGGGYSAHFPEPSWQISNIGSRPGSCPGGVCRATPDVAMFGASPNYWVYSTASDQCQNDDVNRGAGWFGCAGTSLSTPLWAGFLAVALQVRGGGRFGNIDPLLYQLGNSASYSSIFHDITSGSNGYPAGTGWDPVTGWGSPIANSLATSLAQKQVTTDKSTYTQGDTIHYAGTGFTALGSIQACLSTDNDGTLLCVSEPNADQYGNAAGTMLVGTNIPAGPQKFYVRDLTTGWYSSPIQLTITYSVTFSQTGVPGTITWGVTVGGTRYTTTGSSFALSGLTQPMSYSYDTVVPGVSGVQYVCTSGCAGSVSGSTTLSANYKSQYYLNVNSAYGSPNPSSGWFDAATSITASVTSPVSGGTGTQFVCVGWTGSGSVPSSGSSCSVNFSIHAPSSITWNWKTQYQLTITLNGHGASTPSSGNWYDSGSSVQVTISSDASSNSSNTRYLYNGATGSGSGSYTGSSNPFQVTMSAPLTETVTWTTQYMLTMQVSPVNGGTATPTTGWQNAGAVLAISVAPSFGFTFSSWTCTGAGCYSGTNTNPSITMNNIITETANLIPPPQVLTTGVDSGQGSVSPNCPSPSGCSEAVGQSVTVTASASSGWQFASWSTQTGVSCSSNPCTFNMPYNPVTLKATFTLGVGDMGSSVISATATTVWFVLPDYNGPYHTPAAKCGGVNSAQLSDYSAGGYVLGLLSNPQNQLLDTNPSISLTSCGNPTGVTGTIVTLAGPGVNSVVHYYEQVAGITPVYYLWTGSKNNFVVRATGLMYSVPNSAGNTAPGDDLFLIEAFTDGQGRHVFVLYGFSWQGTLAAGEFFASYVYPQLSQFPNAWYIYRWTDAGSGNSANMFPDPGDTYTLVASSGSAPSLSSTSVPPSGAAFSGFAGIGKDVFGASQGSVYFILPDYSGPYHTSSAKCGVESAASLSDYSAGGYILSADNNSQNEVLDTGGLVSSSSGSCGQFLGSTSTAIVTVAGPGVNTALDYYEQIAATTPVYYLWDGARNNFVVRAGGQRYAVSAGNTVSRDDLFLLEAFTDAQGRHVYVIYGFSWQGTLAAATFLNTYVRSHLSSFTNSWYIYEWKDASSGASANSFPDSGDQFNQLATG